MQNDTNSRPFTVWILILLQVFLGLGALGGGGAFLLATDGHLIQMPLSDLENTPFSKGSIRWSLPTVCGGGLRGIGQTIAERQL